MLLAAAGCKGSCNGNGPVSRPADGRRVEQPIKSQEGAAGPAGSPLRQQCLTFPAPAITLSQLNCAPGGLPDMAAAIAEVRNGYLSLFGQSLPNGTIIVRRPESEAVSEGMGFGGVIYGVSGGLAAGGLALSGGNTPDNQRPYWQLYHARNSYFLQSSGAMAWSLNLDGSVRGADSASDGDQDWIASELMVLNRVQCGSWQMPADVTLDSFRTQVQKDLDAFWANHIRERGSRLVFLPTNGSWAVRGDGKDIYYPNYPDPHFLRLFGKFDTAHDWNKLAADVQDLNSTVLDNHSSLGAAGQNPVPAKVFVTVNPDGTFKVENYYTVSRNEGVTGTALVDNEADAIRFFLRQGRAAVLDNDQAARNMLKKIVSITNITHPYSAYLYAGSPGAPSPYGWSNSLARASYGIALLGSGDSQRAADYFCSVLKNHKGDYFGEAASERDHYYDQSIILQALDLAFPRNP